MVLKCVGMLRSTYTVQQHSYKSYCKLFVIFLNGYILHSTSDTHFNHKSYTNYLVRFEFRHS